MFREIGRKCAVERGVGDRAHAHTVDGVGKQTSEQRYRDCSINADYICGAHEVMSRNTIATISTRFALHI